MSIHQLLLLLVAFLFGTLSAYMDFDSFFRRHRVSYIALYKHPPSVIFLCMNGTISLLLLLYAFSSNQSSPINKLIQVQSDFGKMVVISFGVPLILRSRLFALGQERTAVGLAAAYEFFFHKILLLLHLKSIHVKEEIASIIASQYSAERNFPQRIKDIVDEGNKIFGNLGELQKEFEEMQTVYQAQLAQMTDASEIQALTENYFKTLLKWAMDNTSISYIESLLRKR